MAGSMRSCALAAAACALLVGGCGGTSDEDEVKQAFDDYFRAIKDKDGDKLCETVVSPEMAKLSEDGRAKEIEKCRDDFDPSEFDNAPEQVAAVVDKVTVNGDRATATVTVTTTVGNDDRSELQFLKVAGDWKLSFDVR